MVVWGNHSNTQVPDATYAKITDDRGTHDVYDLFCKKNDLTWLQGDFLSTVQHRGAEVLSARKLSSALSAAKAIADHMRDWWLGTPSQKHVSMAILSDGSAYQIPAGVFYSFPVTCQNKSWAIVKDLKIDAFVQSKMNLSATELFEEKEEAFSFLKKEL